MAEYIDLLPADTSPSAIEADIIATIQARWPEWEPSENHLEVWLIRGLALRTSELATVTVDVADEIYARFGEMLGRPRIQAQPATAVSTWTMVDDAGYYIPAGTLVNIARSGNESEAFTVAVDVTVPCGQTTGQVTLIAQEPGAAGTGLTANPQLVDALIYVQGIVLDDPTAGGTDEEPMPEYLDRLTELLQLLTPRPILPRDFEVLARQEIGVYRAVAIDGLDPSDDSTDNERMVTVAVMDEDGEPLPDGTAPATAGTKLYVEEQLDAQREVNFIVHVVDADYTEIDVTAEIVSYPEFTHAGVVAQVEAALTGYLTPINWGRRSGRQWRNEPTVRYLEIAEQINRVPGVDHIESLTINEDGESPGTADLDLDGNVPVTRPGEITIT